jgi:uncharacterized protein YxjI
MSEWTSHPNDYTVGLGVDSVLNVKENSTENQFFVYPNPASNEIYINGDHLDTIANAKIYDASGKLLMNEKMPFKNKNYLNISQLNSGVYFLQIDSKTLKIIKK